MIYVSLMAVPIRTVPGFSSLRFLFQKTLPFGEDIDVEISCGVLSAVVWAH